MRGEGDVVRVGEGGDATGRAESAAMGDVELADLDGAFFKEIPEALKVGDPLAARDGGGDRGIDAGKSLDALGPAGFLEEVESELIEGFAEL